MAAIAAAPEATPEQIEEARRQIELIFEPGRPIEAGGVKFKAWLWFQLKNPQAEAAAPWPVIAVSALLARSDGVASAERLQFRNDLHYAESAANLYFTPSGGWNHLPHQEPADLHAPSTPPSLPSKRCWPCGMRARRGRMITGATVFPASDFGDL